jgi:pepF/M3 family oligoendopeptidase
MDTTSTTTALPHWDMTTIYPSLESPEFTGAAQALGDHISALTAEFDQRGIDHRDSAPLDDATVDALEAITERFNALLDELTEVGTYISSFIATDSRNTAAQARFSEFQQQEVRVSQLGTRFTAWIGAQDVDALVARSAVARAHEYVLRQAKIQATHLMSPAEEALAAELDVTGAAAWSKLHGDMGSQLMVPIELGGEQRELPMSEIRNLAYEADRTVRRRAYEAELATWERVAVPMAAAMNSIKGQVNTLSRRRGWETPLDAALFNNHIDRDTLEAMLQAARESFPTMRRYLRAKAKAIGVPALAWYDLFAPLGSSDRVWAWDDAVRFIEDQFGTFSPKLHDFAARAFRERWIDAEPRPGKTDGAFCMPVHKAALGESRILANFKPAFGGVSTLAHELGHGYHNLNLAERTMLQRDTPMTLAETASIFCETIIREAGLRSGDTAEQLVILEASLQGACQVVVDITSRFLFEQGVFEARQGRELSVEELNALMLDAQRQTYGDGLDPNALHPYMWAVKGHYYSNYSYYNYPYMFGQLFGLGLYARYEADPEGFKTSYDDLLSATGLADAATLANRFGIDIRTPDFWRASLDIIGADVDRFEALVGAGAASADGTGSHNGTA